MPMTDTAVLTLRHRTGDPQADATLHQFVGRFEAAFSGRVRGSYLLGSFADGTAGPGSDLDLGVVFAGAALSDAERAAACRVVADASRSTPVRLDVLAVAEGRLPTADVRLKLASVLLYGADIRPTLPVPGPEAYRRWVTEWPYHFSARVLRGAGTAAYGPPRGLRPDGRLGAPLTSPDPGGECFGYDAVRVRPWYPPRTRRGTKELVATVCWTATALVGLGTGRFAATKGEGVRAYREEVGDAWTGLVEAVYARCGRAWRCRVPTTRPERTWLRERCAEVVGFENRFFAAYRDYLRGLRRAPDPDDRRFAAGRLAEIGTEAEA
jgi:predicted nucleotidyltransferase